MKGRVYAVLAATAVTTVLLFGCGNDNGGGNGVKPITGIEISPGEADVEIGQSLSLEATVSGGDTKAVQWYVNGELNGNSEFGTITENSPVTYHAPVSLPVLSTVVVKAVSEEDESMVDSCLIHLTFTTVYVNADAGDDASGTGCISLPVKTITNALTMAEEGMRVVAAPGIYDRANGEVFPLVPGSGVELVGENWETCILRDHSSTSYEQTLTMTGTGSSFRKFSLEMGEPADTTWSCAIVVYGTDVLVDSIRIFERGNYSVLRISGATNATVQNSIFEVDDALRNDRGFEIVFGDAGTTVRNCRFRGFYTGLFFNNSSDALIEGCTIDFCVNGSDMCCLGHPEDNPNPDFGGGMRGSAGGNTFSNYLGYGIENPTSNAVFAKYNTWENNPPILDVDYTSTGTGSIVVE